MNYCEYLYYYFCLYFAEEPGMLIGLIKQGNASREFNGYIDKEASKKKTIENIFKKGDEAFLTGESNE